MKRITILAVAGLCLCAQAALETAPADFKWGDWQKMRPPKSPEKRMSLIQPVKAGELRLVPTYTSCSVCWGSAPVEGLAHEYRAAGAEWKKGETPIHFLDAANYRGSILCLAEDTDYEMRLTPSATPSELNVIMAREEFRTLVDSAREKCRECVQDDTECEECGLYRLLTSIVPLDEYHSMNLCPYNLGRWKN